MAFLDDVDSLDRTLKLDKRRIAALCAVGLAVLCLLVLGFEMAWNAFAVPSTVIDHEDRPLSDASDTVQDEKMIFVHVAGEVLAPGMYGLSSDARVNDAVAAAGGFTDAAAKDAVNLARGLEDGEQVLIPAEAQESVTQTPIGGNGESPSASRTGTSSAPSSASLVNINTASLADLTALPGVGESTAQKIIADRQANGAFKQKSDLKRVAGIGEKKYAALEELICV